MKEGNRHRRETQPLKAPQSAPVLRASSTAAHSGQRHWAKATPTRAPHKPSTEPTERSISATIKTKVMPVATSIAAGIWLARVRKVSGLKKCRVERLKMSTSRPSAVARPR